MTEKSSASGVSYQIPSTFLFVPSDPKKADITTDDVNTPGAFFRLGGYSTVEGDATATDLALFYPREFIEDVNAAAEEEYKKDYAEYQISKITTGIFNRFHQNHQQAKPAPTKPTGKEAAAASPGKDDAGKLLSGIVLACSGRLLIRSKDETYLHSTKKIDIDTEDEFILNADKKIDIKSKDEIEISSGDNKNITINVGSSGKRGTFTTNSYTAKHKVFEKEYKYVTDDSYTYYQCNIYTYKLGGIVDINMGGRFAYWAGSQLSITTSIDLTISVIASITLYFFKMDIGAFKVDICERKIELKNGKIDFGVWNHKTVVAKTEFKVTAADMAALKNEIDDLRVTLTTVNAETESVTSKVAGLDSEVTNLKSIL